MPTITWLVSAALLPSKPRFQGATIAHRPSSRLAHSSHSVYASNAAIATNAISPPQIHAFQPAVLPAKSKIHGVRNSHAPRIKLTTSTNASLRHFCMCMETSVTKADPLSPQIMKNCSAASDLCGGAGCCRRQIKCNRSASSGGPTGVPTRRRSGDRGPPARANADGANELSAALQAALGHVLEIIGERGRGNGNDLQRLPATGARNDHPVLVECSARA